MYPFSTSIPASDPMAVPQMPDHVDGSYSFGRKVQGGVQFQTRHVFLQNNNRKRSQIFLYCDRITTDGKEIVLNAGAYHISGDTQDFWMIR